MRIKTFIFIFTPFILDECLKPPISSICFIFTVGTETSRRKSPLFHYLQLFHGFEARKKNAVGTVFFQISISRSNTALGRYRENIFLSNDEISLIFR